MKSKKPNLIDVLIILVLVLVTSAAVYRTLSIKQLPDTVKNKEIEYTLLFPALTVFMQMRSKLATRST